MSELLIDHDWQLFRDNDGRTGTICTKTFRDIETGEYIYHQITKYNDKAEPEETKVTRRPAPPQIIPIQSLSQEDQASIQMIRSVLIPTEKN